MKSLKKKYILCLIILSSVILSTRTFAQEILLEQDVNKDTIIPTIGPNYRHFLHSFLGFGIVTGKGFSGAEIKVGLSRQTIFGVRYKLKINSFYAIGVEEVLSINTYVLKQNSSKLLPNKSLHDKESIHFTTLNSGFYNRFNFGKRGNSLGKYLDLGVYGEWLAGASQRYTDSYNYANSSFAKKTSVKNTQLQFVLPFQYGINARLGFSRFIFFAQYRMSKLFKESYNYPELPNTIVGFQIGIY